MPEKNFSDWLPEWAYSALRNRSCSQCDTKYSRKDIIAVGMRELDDKTNALYIEHKCSNCEFRSITNLGKQKEDTLEGLCLAILESIKKKKIVAKSKALQHTYKNEPMTEKEVNKFLDFMKKSDSHEDFMKEIGATPPGKNNDTS